MEKVERGGTNSKRAMNPLLDVAPAAVGFALSTIRDSIRRRRFNFNKFS